MHHKCPLCDGPVSARILYHGNIVYIDGVQVMLTRIEVGMLKIIAQGRRVPAAELAALLDIKLARVGRHGAELRRKLRGTAVHLRKRRSVGEYYLEWQTWTVS